MTQVIAELQREVEQFLFFEARLLDERRWQEWLDLFTAEGVYWVPLARGQTDPINHASLFYENAMLREVRARRLDSPRAFSLQPPTYTSHVIGNITVDTIDSSSGDIVVHSTFHLLEWRKVEQRLLGGNYEHRLKRIDGRLRIELKRVNLVNCDAVHEALQVFI